MKAWKELAKETLEIQANVDLADISQKLIHVIFHIHDNLVAEGKTASFKDIHEHPICKAYAQAIFLLTSASPGLFGHRLDLQVVKNIADPPVEPAE